jgi:hypothetical protein
VAAIPVATVALKEEKRRVLGIGGLTGLLDAGIAESLAVADTVFVAEARAGTVSEVIFEKGGFAFIEAAESPARLGDVLEGKVFAGRLRSEDLAEFRTELFVFSGVLMSENRVVMDGKAMLEGVAAGCPLAFGGAGTGGVRGIRAVALGARIAIAGVRELGGRIGTRSSGMSV